LYLLLLTMFSIVIFLVFKPYANTHVYDRTLQCTFPPLLWWKSKGEKML